MVDEVFSVVAIKLLFSCKRNRNPSFFIGEGGVVVFVWWGNTSLEIKKFL